jgi:hypothetical protein
MAILPQMPWRMEQIPQVLRNRRILVQQKENNPAHPQIVVK